MFNLKVEVEKAIQNKKAIGHFNISNFEMLKAVLLAGQELSQEREETIPLIIGLSESERIFIGSYQAVAFVKSWREEHNYPVFINADHCRTLDSVDRAGKAGFDSIVIDNSNLSLERNIRLTKEAVLHMRKHYPRILLEGELGVIGSHSALLEELPKSIDVSKDQSTTVGEASRFIEETNIDFFAPAVGNIHGMLKKSFNPCLDIDRIKELVEALNVPLVLHGGSGIREKDVTDAIFAGMSIVHISTELRKSYSLGIQNLAKDFFVVHPDEVAPYKIMEPVVEKMKKVVKQKLELFS